MAVVKNSEETKERILLAAQELFAERGFEAVSLRDITKSAEANVAAVNYHFGSKDALIDALVVRNVMPVMEERLRLLKEAEQHAVDGVISVEKILEAFMRPFLTQMSESGAKKGLFHKFTGRCMSDRGSELPEEALNMFRKMLKLFISALSKSLPDVDEDVLVWRLHFSFGVMAHTLLHSSRLREISNHRCGDPDFETTLQRMIDYCKGGLEAGSDSGGSQAIEQNEFLF